MSEQQKTPETFATAFLKMQAAVMPALKDKENPAFKNSKYADLGAVWEAVREALQTNGFIVIQTMNFDVADVWLETVIQHAPTNEKITSRYPLRPTKNDPQGYGSAITYARRYCISAMLGVIPDDDDGNAASRGGNGFITETQAETIFDLIKRTKSDTTKFCAYMKIQSIPDMLAKDYGRAIEVLNAKETKQ